MNLHLWFSFLAATVVLLLIPGPTVLQCIGDALANSGRRNWSTILGVGLGDAVAMSLSLVGAGALLKASAAAFTVMKTIGGLYLVYLGIRAIWAANRSDQSLHVTKSSTTSESAMMRFGKASTITALNPKSILFFVAFVPQFITPQAGFARQAAILLATFVILAMVNAWVYMSLAGFLGLRLQTKTARKTVGYASGGVLLAAGSLTLALKQR